MSERLWPVWEDELKHRALDHPDPFGPYHGISSRVTKAGIRVIELDVWADPAKRDPDGTATTFLERERLRMPDKNRFRREYLRDWEAGDGEGYFPEWQKGIALCGERNPYTIRIPVPQRQPGRPRPLVLRGWDFGRRAPVVTWLQKHPSQRRIFVLRTLAPQLAKIQMPIRNLRDLTRYLSGQAPLSVLNGEDRAIAREWLAWYEGEEEAALYPHPWFLPETCDFMDYGGSESSFSSDFVETRDEAQSRYEVLAERGIHCMKIGAHKDRDTVMRELLEVKPDGWGGIIIDPEANKLLINALSGGLVAAKPTEKEPQPEGHHKDGRFDNVYEALTYAIVGVLGPAQHEAETPQRVLRDRQVVLEAPASEGFGLMETRGDRWA